MSKQSKRKVKMVNVGSKKVTKRTAIAEAFINLSSNTRKKIYKDKIIKGDVISVATKCNSSSKTGVEMEALLAASVTALTIYDMCKSLDKSIVISKIRLLAKKGGKSGNYKR